MALNFPKNRSEIDKRIKTDIQTELQESNPFLRASFLAALASGNAGRFFEIYIQIQNAIDECFPTTADGDFLKTWGYLVGVQELPAAQSRGRLAVTGTDNTVVPIAALFTSNSALQIATKETATILLQSFSVDSLTRSGNIVTVKTFTSPNGFAEGLSVEISGADQSEYNGTFTISEVISVDTFKYNILTEPLSPATGSIFVSATFASIDVESTTFGEVTNTAGGTVFNLDTPISGADSAGVLDPSGLSGGADGESDEDFRARIIDELQNPITPFNSNYIRKVAKSVPGVTRVFIREPTIDSADPELGQVVIQFVRDNDNQIIPTPSEIETVKNEILKIKPAHTADDDVIVRAPAPKIVDFQFISVTPNDAAIQNAIRESLSAFFTDDVTLGVDILEEAYKCDIFGTVDPDSGRTVTDFQLLTPLGDIVVGKNELPILGTVIFS